MQGVYIVSENNNQYFYNNETGFIELQKEKINAIKNIKDKDENADFKIRYATEDEVKKDLFGGTGFRQLILEVTQDCNLACKYCCFGNHYKNSRSPSHKKMSYDIAKKAIDYYIKVFGEKTYINPGKNPSIGFYGGEPLLNFKLIKEMVEYVHETYPEYKYDHNVTTNGVLLTEEVMDFLVKYDFSIVISLDGNKKAHDRNRVKTNGKGSFDEVMANIKTFRTKYPGYHKLAFSTCYDYKSDLEELKQFIEDEDLFIVALNMISTIETDYYEQFTKEDEENFYKSINKLQSEFIDLAKKDEVFGRGNNIYSPLFLVSYLDLCSRSLLTQRKREFLPYGGCCIPGEKIYVAVDGKFHACERISNKFPIGLNQ